MLWNVVRPDRVELPTFWFVAKNARIINNLQGTARSVTDKGFIRFAAEKARQRARCWRPRM